MTDLKIGCIVIGSVQTNCYFLYREGSKEALCIDPGDNGEMIYGRLREKGLSVGAILLTHGHFDHIWGVEALKHLSNAEVYAFEGEKKLLEDAGLNVSRQAGVPCTVSADIYVRDGEILNISGAACKVIATPGHTAGSCCYYFEEDRILFSGDTLFLESVGRTDFPTGSGGALGRSLKEKLAVLPKDVQVYPGHGDVTTIGHEMKYNPFCQ